MLVVGVGSSGADIAMEVVKHHATWLAGQESAAVPFVVGVEFMYSATSATITAVGRDARRVVKHLTSRPPTPSPKAVALEARTAEISPAHS
ncbi:MAG: hypothetical protein ABI658_28140 [Acidimicrobiales bacterium]